MNKVFKNNPDLQVYFKTSDGTAFYKESDAKAHTKSLKNKSVETVTRGVSEDEPEATGTKTGKEDNTGNSVAKMEWRDAIKAIQEAETLEALEQFKGYTQASVIKALEEKTAELTANIDVNAVQVTGTEDNQNQE